jgi:acyl-CoA hydrolase/GNAT superfamily N-acetyltransferase
MTSLNLRRREIVSRTVTVTEALAAIPAGSTVFVGTGAGEPQALVDSLADLAARRSLRLLFGFSLRRPPRLASPVPVCSYLHVGYRQAVAMEEGLIDWTPVDFAQTPSMFARRRIPIDVAVVSVSPADAHGQFSLGTSVDITRAAVEAASLVIAQINPFVPRTHGQSFLDYRKINYFTQKEEPLPEVFEKKADTAVEEEIARNVVRVIPDGATLQLGFPRLPRQLLSRMSEKRDLGVHSLLISDWVMELLENGTVTNARKSWCPGKVVASCALGSRRFYDYLNDSPVFEFQTADVVADPQVIGRNPHFVSVLDAECIDLQGRANFANSPFSQRLSAFLGSSGTGAHEGQTVLVLPARDPAGRPSIRVQLDSEGTISHGRVLADTVVTEHGVAFLRGKSLQQRALQLIPLMHPDDRGTLWSVAVARRHFCPAYARRVPASVWTLAPPAGADTSVTVRTAHIQDFEAARRFHYSLPEQDLNLRFFDHHMDLDAYLLGAFGNERAQLFFAVAAEADEETILGVAECHVEDASGAGEIALITHPQHRRRGVGRALVAALTAWATARGLSELRAEVLASNVPMLQTLRRCGWTGAPKDGSERFVLALTGRK